jgi:23S rRNA (pseudouridine1915-N3)-methyltransferase
MKFNLVVFSGNVPQWVSAAFDHYEKRFRAPYALSLIYKDFDSPNSERNNAKKLNYLDECNSKHHYNISLDSGGANYNTISFTDKIKKISSSHQNISFFIGGSEGHCADFLERSHHILSLSKMTFGHQIMIPLTTEILYRTYSLIIGHPYHRS